MKDVYKWFEKNVANLDIKQVRPEGQPAAFLATGGLKFMPKHLNTPYYDSELSDTPDQAAVSLKKIMIETKLNDTAKGLREAQASMIAVEAWAKESGS